MIENHCITAFPENQHGAPSVCPGWVPSTVLTIGSHIHLILWLLWVCHCVVYHFIAQWDTFIFNPEKNVLNEVLLATSCYLISIFKRKMLNRKLRSWVMYWISDVLLTVQCYITINIYSRVYLSHISWISNPLNPTTPQSALSRQEDVICWLSLVSPSRWIILNLSLIFAHNRSRFWMTSPVS